MFTWRNAILGGVGALALWGVVAAVWLIGQGTVTGAVTESEPRVLAVLPFDNLLPEPEEQAWLVAGLHEQVIHEIQRLGIPGLRVISRTSVLPLDRSEMTVPEIAERLQADMLLEGSVRGDGTRLRTTIQLIDAATDHHEWSQEFDASLDGGFLDAQAEVAARVARTFTAGAAGVASSVGVRPATANGEAMRAYLQGRYLWKNLGAPPGEGAMARFREAVELDPDFALAWAALAEAWLAAAHFGTPPDQAFPRADSLAVQALARDPELAEAHIALADTRFHYDWNWTGAERGFRRGLELNPSHATGHWFLAGLLAALGRTDEAVPLLEAAQRLDPASVIAYAFGARVLYWGRRYDAAGAQAAEALALAPTHPYALGALGFIRLAEGRVEDGVRAFERSVAVSPKFLPGLALALGRAGRMVEAREVVARVEAAAAERYVAPYERAFAHVGIGDHDRALELLEEALETRDAELIWLAVEPAFDPIRDDPRFRAVLETMGLAGVGAG